MATLTRRLGSSEMSLSARASTATGTDRMDVIDEACACPRCGLDPVTSS
jgi:hypothetical protein